jgi:shikimate kinase
MTLLLWRFRSLFTRAAKPSRELLNQADSAASIQQLLTDRYQVIRYCCDALTDTRM